MLKPESPSSDRKSHSSPPSPTFKRTKNKGFSSFRAKDQLHAEKQESIPHPHSPRSFMKCLKHHFVSHGTQSPKGHSSSKKFTFKPSPQPEIVVSPTADVKYEQELPRNVASLQPEAAVMSSLSLQPQLTPGKGLRSASSGLSMESGYTSDSSRINSSSDIFPMSGDIKTSSAYYGVPPSNFHQLYPTENSTECGGNNDVHPNLRFKTNGIHHPCENAPLDSPIYQSSLKVPSSFSNDASSTSLTSSVLSSSYSSTSSSLSDAHSNTQFQKPTMSFYRVTPKKYLKKSRATSALHLSEVMSDNENGVLRRLQITIHDRCHSVDGELPKRPSAKPLHSTPKLKGQQSTDGACGPAHLCQRPTVATLTYHWSTSNDIAPDVREWMEEEVCKMERRVMERVMGKMEERIADIERDCEQARGQMRAQMRRECSNLSEEFHNLETKRPKTYSQSSNGVRVFGSMDSVHINVTLPQSEQSQSMSDLLYERRDSTVASCQPFQSLREVDVKQPHELPCQQVACAVLRALSNELSSWKFTARALGLSESEIDRIHLDNQSETREQCYKMLQHWKQQLGRAATYKTLGLALYNEAKSVYPKYFDIVSSFT